MSPVVSAANWAMSATVILPSGINRKLRKNGQRPGSRRIEIDATEPGRPDVLGHRASMMDSVVIHHTAGNPIVIVPKYYSRRFGHRLMEPQVSVHARPGNILKKRSQINARDSAWRLPVIVALLVVAQTFIVVLRPGFIEESAAESSRLMLDKI